MPSSWLTEELSEQIKQNENFQENAALICEDIMLGKLDLTLFVERLVGVLTDTDDMIRARGLQIYSQVLKRLPEDFITEQQLKYITVFYLAKLRDDYLVITPALVGTLALFGMKHLPQDMHKELIKAMFLSVNCQQQPYADRHNIYCIIRLFSINYPKDLQELGNDFVGGFISSMEGERDPRNLMLLFNMLPSLLKLMHLGEATERMFDVMACYFPIAFQPLQDDPNAISRNDLAEKLCMCLCAIPSFAEFCLPLLTKKIDSTLKLARLDSLKLLEKSCETFTPLSYEPHLSTILSSLLEDMSPKVDEEITQCAHSALSALVRNICADESESKIFTPFLRQILTAMQCLLPDIKDKTSLEMPLKVFLTTAGSTNQSCVFICQNALPIISAAYGMVSDDKCKVSILKWFTALYQICERLHTESNEYFKYIPEICLSAIISTQNDLKVAGFETLTSMTKSVQLNDLSALPDILYNCIHNESCERISNASKQCLLSLANKFPEYYLELINDKLNLHTLPNDTFQAKRRIDTVCSLVSVDQFCNLIVPKIFDTLNGNANILFSNIIIAALVDNFGQKDLFDDSKLQRIQHDHDILKQVLIWCNNNINKLGKSDALNLSLLISIIMHSQEKHVQQVLYANYLPIYLDQTQKENSYVIILKALLKSSKPDVVIQNLSSITLQAVELATNEKDSFLQQNACVIVAIIFNKYGISDTSQLYSNMQKGLFDVIDDTDGDDLIYANVIELCSWITKALLLRGDSHATSWITKIIEVLGKDKWGMQGAKCFKQIMNDSEDLSADYFCQINKFYRQKVMQQFSLNTNGMKRPSIINSNREPYLLAWAYIIQSVPKTVIKMQASMILPFLFESLDYSNPDVLLSALSSLSYFIQMKNSSVVDSLQTILPRFIKLSKFPTSMNVRIVSLQCLFDVANCFPTILLLPYKQDTVIQMAKCLDDPKRLVRNIAAKARCRWFLVGSSEEKKN